MKIYNILLLLISLLLSSVCLQAQMFTHPGSPGTISSYEKARFEALNVKHESGLVNNYDLKYHRFHWLVDPAQASIRGSVTSYYVPTVPNMSSIQFELAPEMSADSVYHRGFKKGIIHVGNLVTVNFGEFIPQNTVDSVTIFYHGDPPNNGMGSFNIKKHNGVPCLWTLSEPYGASDWWPSKNDLSDKIDSIDVFVAAPNGYKVASNGVLQGEAPYGPNLTATHWKHKYPVASYLIAIAVTNYAHYTEFFVGGGNNTFPIENYVYPEDSTAISARTAELIPVYGLYSALFGPYPFAQDKYGHAEFGWGGGMEHQTMTFIGQDDFNIEILSHELSHQWFGDMVTCGSWHDIWLNEGFATYCAGLMYENLSPNLYWPIWKHNNISNVTSKPGGTVYCDDTTNVSRIFDSRLSYSKGAMVLHQLRWLLGDSVFFTGTREYLEDPALQYGFSLTENYRHHMETASGQDLTEYFDDWIYKEGYPSYTITCSQQSTDSLSVSISQTQSITSVSFFPMHVPVRFMGQEKDTLMVFDNTENGQAFLVNPGFKVDSVQFDPDQWLITANNAVALGMNDLPPGKALTLQPNPASGKLRVKHNLGTFQSIVLTDLSGKNLPAEILENNDNTLLVDISHLDPGIYLVGMVKDKMTICRRFIVAR